MSGHPSHDYASDSSSFSFLDEYEADTSFVNSTVTYVSTRLGSVAASFLPDTSSGGANFGLDSSAGTPIVIANNATVTPFGNVNNFGGLFLISEFQAIGSMAMFLTSQGIMIEVADATNGFTVTINNAGTINVYLAAGVVTVQNKTGSSVTVRVTGIRLRSQNF